MAMVASDRQRRSAKTVSDAQTEMKKTKKTRIRIETDELIIVKRIGSANLLWCERCAAQTYPATVDEAAALLGVGPEAVCRRIETGKLHLLENPEGKTLVCLRLF